MVCLFDGRLQRVRRRVENEGSLRGEFMQRYEVGLNKEQDVLIDWHQLVRHVIFTPEQAIEFANYLIKHAKQSKKYTQPQ